MIRKYTVDEVVQMRAALRVIVQESEPGVCSTNERNVMAEMQLRTYMLNGTEPEELEKERRDWEITAAMDDDL